VRAARSPVCFVSLSQPEGQQTQVGLSFVNHDTAGGKPRRKSISTSVSRSIRSTLVAALRRLLAKAAGVLSGIADVGTIRPNADQVRPHQVFPRADRG
jgi:hypothetical protein